MKYETEDPRITAYLFDELEPDETIAFEAELERSAELRQLVDQTRGTIEALKTEFAHAERLQLTDKQWATVRSELSAPNKRASVSPANRNTSESARPARTRRVPWARWAAVGAMAAAVLALASTAFLPMMRIDRNRQANVDREKNSTVALLPDNPPLVYPDAEKWSDLQGRHKRWAQVNLGKDATDGQNPTDESAPEADLDSLVNIITSTDETLTVAKPVYQGVETEFTFEGASQSGKIRLPAVLIEPTQRLETIVVRGYREEIERFRGEPSDTSDHGNGPGQGGDKYNLIVENDFLRVTEAPLSTFSIDVDTASYSKVRMYLRDHNRLPRPDAVRIEELINYFPYDYEQPTDEHPFAVHQSVTNCPWNLKHRLVRIGIKGKEIDQDERPASNLVFLLDVSGSMDQPNKLPLLQRGMKMLVDQLGENDRVAIVVYAGAAGMVLDSTNGDQNIQIMEALDRLRAGGSTNGGAGIQLAYQTALDHFITGGVNRVVLCTDGDFNVGTTGNDELVRIIEQHAKTGIFLSVLGFGMGNHNDSMLEQISNSGNGNYAFIDTDNEARKVLSEQISATLVTIAKDVKIQVDFNPAEVAAYRLIGYENRVMATQDFNDDTKDAGEIGAGHTVTALYEIVPAGEQVQAAPPVDELRYQSAAKPTHAAESGELLWLKLRYKQPDGDTSTLLTFPLKDADHAFHDADRDFQFAAAVASFGMLLRDSKYKGNATYASVQEIAAPAADGDTSGYRHEFLVLVQRAAEIAGE